MRGRPFKIWARCPTMLRILEIEDRKPVHEWLTQLAFERQTWVLSDLRTKFEIQDFFLKERGFYTEEAVLRVSDLWKKILLRVDPEIRVLTPQAAQMHLRYFLKEFSQAVDLKDNSDPTLLKWMKDLAVIYFHPQGSDRIEEWFEQNPQQKALWKDWWLRSKAAFLYFENKKMLLPQWIPAYLQSVPDLQNYWNRELLVDLGGQITAVEAGLLQNISQFVDVTVLAPKIKNEFKYSFLLRPYEDLKAAAKIVQHRRTEKKSQIETGRFASTLGSIRQTTVQIREWIEQGVPPSEIAVIAPDIESLWLVLKYHFDQEGIPYNKETVVPLQGLSEVQFFLAQLRSLSQNLSLRDLELAYFRHDNSPEIIFEKFYALFRNLYDELDYKRHASIQSLVESDLSLQKALTPDEFLVRMMLVWCKADVPLWLETLLREILGSFDASFALPWKEWIVFCESCLAKKEQIEGYADPEGVFVTNIMSAHFLKGRRRIFLELSEECLKVSSRKGISAETSSKLAHDLGFWLENSDQSSLEFELEWLLQDATELDLLYFSVAQLNGSTQTPSSLWLEYAKENAHKLTRPKKTVHDSKLVGFGKTEINERILHDLGRKTLSALKAWEEAPLSPSAVEAFLQCPFVYYARQTLSLRTFPEVDLDQDRRDLGQAIHKIFERILRQGLDYWGRNQIDQLLEELKPQYFPYVDQEFWAPQKAKLLKLVQKFILFEKEWKAQFPGIVKHDLEVKWEGKQSGLSFRGQIDRVDRSADGKIVVIDYKNSSYNLKGLKDWFKEGHLQMLFYINALEKGWAPDLKGDVVAALYYVVKNFNRELGFEVVGEWPGFYQNTSKKNQKVSIEEKENILKEFEQLVDSIVDRLRKGEMTPQPRDEQECDRCDWRKICRSPHLM